MLVIVSKVFFSMFPDVTNIVKKKRVFNVTSNQRIHCGMMKNIIKANNKRKNNLFLNDRIRANKQFKK